MSDHEMDARPPARSPADSSSGSAGAEAGAPPVTLEIDEANDDLEKAMRDALAAVESVHGERAASPNAGGAGGAPAETPGETEAALRREIADLRDRSVRTLADFDNYRKRADRERQETRRYALLEPLREFLPIADNLGRALSAGGSADDLKRGIEMIHRQMDEMLRRFGVREVPAAGEVFNPAVHEAVARVESDAIAIPTVAETLVPGYMLHDRLLRPAMVKVAVPVEKAAGAAADSSRE
jgi:molecular chaperone GrpE